MAVLPAGAPGVNIKEVDLSTLVPSFPGVYGGIVIQAAKGPVNSPQLVTNDSQLLSIFTPKGTIEVGFDLAYFSALAYLQRSSTLWVVRSNNGGLHGGVSIKVSNSSAANAAWVTGLEDPSTYIFDSSTPVPGLAEVFSATSVNIGSFYDVIGAAKYWTFFAPVGTVPDITKFYVYYVVTDGVNTQQDPGVANALPIKVEILLADTAAQIAVKTSTALLAKQVDLYDVVNTAPVLVAVITVTLELAGVVTSAADGAGAATTGFTFAVLSAGTNPVNTDELFILFGKDVGAWNNDVAVKIINYLTDPLLVGEPGAFMIQVFTTANLSNPVEAFVCSRDPQAKDGFGNNIYIETVLNGSNYIRAIDNVAIDKNIVPEDQAALLYFAEGDDGSAVTDSQMIIASDTLGNVNSLPLTVFMDGGWATPAYQKNLDDIVSSRQDSVALLSVPYASEAASSYLNAIVEYRTTTLNLDSSYSAMYTPHPLVFDQYNNRQIYVAPDGYAGAAISFSASNFQIWFPPAGYTRGAITTVLGLRRNFTDGEIATLYKNGINPIKFAPSRGIAIWAQKTLTYRPSALNRLNVRLLLITIEPAIAEALQYFVFEINDTQTQALITSIVQSYLDRILADQGLYAFTVICNETNNTPAVIDANELICDVYVQPTKAAEFITLRTIITATGASVTTG